MIMDFLIKKAKYIHFIGIGGISMSGLATLTLKKKIKVSGSDVKDSDVLHKLKNLGATIFIGHKASNISYQDLVVFTGAIKKDNAEMVEAKKLGIPCIERSEYLGYLSSKFQVAIAVAGTHGKTTTTAMLSKCFLDAKLCPEIHLGGCVDFLKGSVKSGKNIFITEACEYRESFLKLKRNYAVILNMEADHLDYYKTFKSMQSSFVKFANRSNTLITSCEIANKYKFKCSRVLTISLNDSTANYCAKNLILSKNGGYSFEVYKNGTFFYNFTLKILGKFNVYNALSVIAICDEFNINKVNIYQSLLTFKGVKRRLEYIGELNNLKVIHDYAHHPTEIENVLNGFRDVFSGELIVVFQPHTYSRTKDLLNEFVKVLSSNIIDKLILVPTYPAREKKEDGVSASELAQVLKKKRQHIYYMSLKKAKKFLCDYSNASNIAVLVLGAGDIETFARDLIK